MDKLLKSQILLEDMAMAIAKGNEEEAQKYYEEYIAIYENITKKKFPKTFEELKRLRKIKNTKQETEIEI